MSVDNFVPDVFRRWPHIEPETALKIAEFAREKVDGIRFAVLDTLNEHIPLHDIDEWGNHSKSCDACALDRLRDKLNGAV